MSLFSGLNLNSKVDDFKKKINNSMMGVKENTLTPADTTLSNMKDGIALINNRDTGVAGVVNNYKTNVVEQLDGVIGALKNGTLNEGHIDNLIKVTKEGLKIDKKTLIGNMGKSLGLNFTDKAGALKQVADLASNQFDSLSKLGIGGLVTTDGKKIRLAANWQDKLGSETLKQVTKMTGIDNYLDITVRAALHNSIFKNAAKYGMSDSFEDIYNSYPKGFEEIKRGAVLDILGDLINRGDIVSTSSMLDLLGQEGVNVINSKYPNCIETIFSQFKFDQDVKPKDHPVILLALKNLLTKIGGSNWYQIKTEFGTAVNLKYFIKMSSDTKTLLLDWDELVPLMAIGRYVKEDTPVNVLNTAFKYVPKFDV